MSKNPQPTPEELRFVYDMITKGYDVNAMLNEYCRLYDSGQIIFPFRTDKRFFRKRKIELEAAEDVLKSRDMRQPASDLINPLQGHYENLTDIAKALLDNGLDNIRKKENRIYFGDSDVSLVFYGELAEIFESNLESARHKFSIDDIQWLIFHIEAEDPEIKEVGFQTYLEEEPYALVELLRLLIRRKTFKGKCPVCKDW